MMQQPLQPQMGSLQQQEHQMDPDQDNQAWIASDEFRMYHFKITLCSKRFNHDWNFCPYSHSGERACRRDPLRYNYTSVTCLDMLQKGKCPRGDACGAAHSVFEYWLHPHRYRTEMCKVGAGCNRRICFFAHKPEELRPLPSHLAAACAPDGTSAGKYSLSAALPGGSRCKDTQQLSGEAVQQAGAAGQKGRQSILPAQAGFLHGISSSSSSSTSIVNLSNSMLGSNNGSNTNSPSTATAGWLLPAGREDSPGAAVIGMDPLTLVAPGAIATSTAVVGPVQLAAGNSPHRLYTPVAAGMANALPPRVPQMTAAASAGYAPQWHQMHAAAANAPMQAGHLGVGMDVQGQQQAVMMMNMQQQAALACTTGLASQLQELNLSDIGGPAGGVPMTTGLTTVPGMSGEMLPQGQLLAVNWQQQQHMAQLGLAPQQQQQLLVAQGGAPAAAVSSAALGGMHPQAIAVTGNAHQQQLLLQGQVIAQATAGMCAMTLPAQQYPQQQQLNFLQPGHMLAEGSWHA